MSEKQNKRWNNLESHEVVNETRKQLKHKQQQKNSSRYPVI